MGDEFRQVMGAKSYGILEVFILDYRTIALAQRKVRSDE